MARMVDHGLRRAEISDALVRLAGREGLNAVTMRSVAVEAGVSVRLVQYYFETKARLVSFALRRLEEESNERWEARLAGLPRPVSARSLLEAFIAEALPTDEESRAFHLVWSSFTILSVTDESLPNDIFVEGPARLEARLSEVLEEARSTGEISQYLIPEIEAARLAALNHGLSMGILVGQRTAEAAENVLKYHLDELFETSEGF